MLKNKLYLLVALPLVIVLGACAGIAIPGLTKSTQASQSAGGANFDLTQMPLEQKLAIGTLKLEGTPQAVNATQASALLPLWQAVKSLSANSNTAPAEITAVYTQIEGVMTTDQTQAIQKMTWTQPDMQALMTQYGVQIGNGQGGQTLTADQRAKHGRPSSNPAARIAEGAVSVGRAASRGGGGGFGGGQGGTSGPSTTQRTPQPGQGGGRGGMGMNSLFIDPLIKLLQTRAGGQ